MLTSFANEHAYVKHNETWTVILLILILFYLRVHDMVKFDGKINFIMKNVLMSTTKDGELFVEGNKI